MSLLVVHSISKTYGNGKAAVYVLKDICFSVSKGKVVAETGSGKSTMLNMIGALDTPSSGRVLIDSKDIFAMKDRGLTILFPILLDYQKPNKKYVQTIIMITHSRSIAQTADRVLQVSDGVLNDFGRCRE